jgi:nitroreductase
VNERYDAILALRAIRQFADRPVEPDDLRAVLEAARWTGSSKNLQRWSFIVVDDADQKSRLCAAGDFMVPVANAPVAICLVEEPGGYEFDTGRVAQNIMLAADALGMATCPVTLHRDDVAREVLELPEGWRCRYAVAVGYPAIGASPRRFGGRKPLDELVHRNRYGG